LREYCPRPVRPRDEAPRVAPNGSRHDGGHSLAAASTQAAQPCLLHSPW
jgi:hypothetical protein